MNTIWLVSYVALWLMVALLTAVVILLARQLGLLYRRLGPAPARMENDGPAIGEAIPEILVQTINGDERVIGGNDLTGKLLVFVSTGCPACSLLAPAIRTVWKKERGVVETLMISLSKDEHLVREFMKRNKLVEVPCIISPELVRQYNIHSPPYGVLLDRHGIVRAKGLINNLDHIESLIHAAEIGYPTADAYIDALNASDPALAVK